MSIIMLAFVLVVSLPASPTAAERARLRPVLDAIRYVESGNRSNPPDGDDGRSIGPYQIMAGYHADGCGCGDYQSVRTQAHAEATVIGYWRRHCPRAMKRGEWETLARVHNGGPVGHHKTATRKYWQKVRKAMQQQKGKGR